MNKSSLDSRPSSLATTRFFQELFGNSLHFPIANVLLETLVEGPLYYLTTPDPYAILFAGVLQAFILNRWQSKGTPRRFIGNLIGPAVYTVIETAFEGLTFLQSSNLIAYWVFSLLFGILQGVRPGTRGWWNGLTVIVEDICRAAILAVMYYVLELKTDPVQTVSIWAFLNDPGHVFIVLVALLLGLNAGIGSLKAQRSLSLLHETARKLKTYSDWLFGRDLLGQGIEDASALQLKRQQRAVLFMDIRGFTRWGEMRPSEDVVNLLNRYYQTAETTLGQHSAIKYKFSGDEVMAVFASVDQALEAALKLRLQINALLGRHGLSAGIGLHTGHLVEGLLGSKDVRFYDVVGDTVHVAKCIESAAEGGELLISEAVRMAIGTTFRAGQKRQVTVKGKKEPVTIYPLE
jgi:class 3 adenylate cyclase